ncbi:unnamed protein product [Dovyalis caffra]|uniref:Uncharacterized protein n=1 Tax=Dovyalis caffra TaxID=77055 RepID=A0AAV1SI82_9ROSI|nr:unnamed protein product [Dovyalis caffra]
MSASTYRIINFYPIGTMIDRGEHSVKRFVSRPSVVAYAHPSRLTRRGSSATRVGLPAYRPPTRVGGRPTGDGRRRPHGPTAVGASLLPVGTRHWR